MVGSAAHRRRTVSHSAVEHPRLRVQGILRSTSAPPLYSTPAPIPLHLSLPLCSAGSRSRGWHARRGGRGGSTRSRTPRVSETLNPKLGSTRSRTPRVSETLNPKLGSTRSRTPRVSEGALYDRWDRFTPDRPPLAEPLVLSRKIWASAAAHSWTSLPLLLLLYNV